MASYLRLQRLLHCVTVFCQISSVLALRAISVPIRINCGSSVGVFSSLYGTTWIADKYFAGGNEHNISNAYATGLGDQPELTTLRAFPSGNACYNIPVPAGKYLIRIGLVYDNYDGLNDGPAFDVRIGNSIVDFFDANAAEQQNDTGLYYNDYIVYTASSVSLCLDSSRGVPFLNSLEISPVDTQAYTIEGAVNSGRDLILRTAVRLNGGGPEINAEPADPGFRTWRADFEALQANYTQVNPSNYSYINSNVSIASSGSAASPDYLPTGMFQTARAASVDSGNITGFAITTSPISSLNTWYLRIYLAELDTKIKVGDRVFDIFISTSGNYSLIKEGYDIKREVGTLNGTVVTKVFAFANSDGLVSFAFGCRRSTGSKLQPILNGVELFEVIDIGQPLSATLLRQHRSVGPLGVAITILAGLLGLAFLGMLAFFIILCVRRQRADGEHRPPPPAAPRRRWSGFPRFSFSGNRALAQTQPTDDVGLPIRSNPYERSTGGEFGPADSDGFRSVELSNGR